MQNDLVLILRGLILPMYSNSQKEAVGIRVVATFVREPWACGWQEYEARNDNGVDGVVIMRKGQRETGGLVFVQVKCGGNGYRQDQQQHPDKVGVSLGSGYLRKHKNRWKSVNGPCVIVFVDDAVDRKNPPAWWADLKSEDTYSKTNSGLLLIPKGQRFGSHTKGDFHRLCGSGPIDKTLPVITAERADLIIPAANQTMQQAARGFYKQWSIDAYASLTGNPCIGPVLVNRVGWRHITGQSRLRERQFQSLTLLGIAKRMVNELDDVEMLGRASVEALSGGDRKITDHLGLRTNVIFPHRHQAVIQVVFRRERVISTSASAPPQQKVWFLSVYELRRGVKQE